MDCNQNNCNYSQMHNIINDENINNIIKGNSLNKIPYIRLSNLYDVELGKNTTKLLPDTAEKSMDWITWFANIVRYIMNIYKNFCSICLVIYFFIMCWIIFR